MDNIRRIKNGDEKDADVRDSMSHDEVLQKKPAVASENDWSSSPRDDSDWASNARLPPLTKQQISLGAKLWLWIQRIVMSIVLGIVVWLVVAIADGMRDVARDARLPPVGTVRLAPPPSQQPNHALTSHAVHEEEDVFQSVESPSPPSPAARIVDEAANDLEQSSLRDGLKDKTSLTEKNGMERLSLSEMRTRTTTAMDAARRAAVEAVAAQSSAQRAATAAVEASDAAAVASRLSMRTQAALDLWMEEALLDSSQGVEEALVRVQAARARAEEAERQAQSDVTRARQAQATAERASSLGYEGNVLRHFVAVTKVATNDLIKAVSGLTKWIHLGRDVVPAKEETVVAALMDAKPTATDEAPVRPEKKKGRRRFLLFRGGKDGSA